MEALKVYQVNGLVRNTSISIELGRVSMPPVGKVREYQVFVAGVDADHAVNRAIEKLEQTPELRQFKETLTSLLIEATEGSQLEPSRIEMLDVHATTPYKSADWTAREVIIEGYNIAVTPARELQIPLELTTAFVGQGSHWNSGNATGY